METLPTFSFIKQEVIKTTFSDTVVAVEQAQNSYENGTDNNDSSATLNGEINLSQLLKNEIKRLFHCVFCNKAFPSNAALLAHIHSHTKEKPYLCAYCEKTFSLKYSLQEHSVLHRKVLPFQCQICHKDYPSKHKLKQHELQAHLIGTMLEKVSWKGKTHENYKPAKCNICNRTYSNTYTLKTHLNIHDRAIKVKEEKFNCTQCGNIYFSERELHEHNSLAHLETGIHWNVWDTTNYQIRIKTEVEAEWAGSAY